MHKEEYDAFYEVENYLASKIIYYMENKKCRTFIGCPNEHRLILLK